MTYSLSLIDKNKAIFYSIEEDFYYGLNKKQPLQPQEFEFMVTIGNAIGKYRGTLGGKALLEEWDLSG